MEIKNRNEKRIYDLIITDIARNPNAFSVLTNVEIGTILNLSPITCRDKVIKLSKENRLVSLVSHFDENNKYFARKLLKGALLG